MSMTYNNYLCYFRPPCCEVRRTRLQDRCWWWRRVLRPGLPSHYLSLLIILIKASGVISGRQHQLSSIVVISHEWFSAIIRHLWYCSLFFLKFCFVWLHLLVCKKKWRDWAPGDTGRHVLTRHMEFIWNNPLRYSAITHNMTWIPPGPGWQRSCTRPGGGAAWRSRDGTEAEPSHPRLFGDGRPKSDSRHPRPGRGGEW